MKCRQCGQDLGNADARCPKCGCNNSAEVLAQVLKDISKLRGMERMKDGKFLVSAFSDLAPKLKQERTMLDFFVRADGPNNLISCINKGADAMSLQITRTAGRMHNEFLTDLNMATSFCTTFASVVAPGIIVQQKAPATVENTSSNPQKDTLTGLSGEQLKPAFPQRSDRSKPAPTPASGTAAPTAPSTGGHRTSLFERLRSRSGSTPASVQSPSRNPATQPPKQQAVDYDAIASSLFSAQQSPSFSGSWQSSSKGGTSSQLLTLHPGDKLCFSTAYASSTGLLEWTVLEADFSTALLLLDGHQDLTKKMGGKLRSGIRSGNRIRYNQDNCETTWESCSLRAWLNSTFYDVCFAPEQQAAILECTLENSQILSSGMKDYGFTRDSVFLLSVEEYQRYKPLIDADQSNGGYASTGYDPWWLRTPGPDTQTTGVNDDGSLYRLPVFFELPLRAAIKINVALAAPYLRLR